MWVGNNFFLLALFFLTHTLDGYFINRGDLPVAKPYSDDLLLHVEAVCDVGDLLGGGLGVLAEGALQGDPDGRLDGSPLLPAATHAVGGGQAVAVDAGVVQGAVSILQPLLEKRLELAHVLEG